MVLYPCLVRSQTISGQRHLLQLNSPLIAANLPWLALRARNALRYSQGNLDEKASYIWVSNFAAIKIVHASWCSTFIPFTCLHIWKKVSDVLGHAICAIMLVTEALQCHLVMYWPLTLASALQEDLDRSYEGILWNIFVMRSVERIMSGGEQGLPDQHSSVSIMKALLALPLA